MTNRSRGRRLPDLVAALGRVTTASEASAAALRDLQAAGVEAATYVSVSPMGFVVADGEDGAPVGVRMNVSRRMDTRTHHLYVELDLSEGHFTTVVPSDDVREMTTALSETELARRLSAELSERIPEFIGVVIRQFIRERHPSPDHTIDREAVIQAVTRSLGRRRETPPPTPATPEAVRPTGKRKLMLDDDQG